MFDRPFECETQLSIERCKSIVTEAFPERRRFMFARVLRTHLTEETEGFTFGLIMQSGRGFFVNLNAEAMRQDSIVLIKGQVGLAKTTMLLFTYFTIIGIILCIVFRRLPWLSIFFLFGIFLQLFWLTMLLRSRTQLLDLMRTMLQCGET